SCPTRHRAFHIATRQPAAAATRALPDAFQVSYCLPFVDVLLGVFWQSAAGYGRQHPDFRSRGKGRFESGACAIGEAIDMTTDGWPRIAEPIAHSRPPIVELVHQLVDVRSPDLDPALGLRKKAKQCRCQDYKNSRLG